jgi:hypothetical protein
VQGSHQGFAVLDQDRKVLFLKALDRCGAGRFDNLASVSAHPTVYTYGSGGT